MFNSLKGKLTEKRIDTVCMETPAGVEWLLEVSHTTLNALPSVGHEIRLYTWLLHREDQMKLLGFSSPGERDLFEELLSVNGVGPKGALKILSLVPADTLAECIEKEDIETLCRVPGIGRKTVQKIMLQLKGKLLSAQEGIPVGDSRENDVLESLVAMGFERKEVRTVLAELLKNDENQAYLSGGEEQLLMRKAIVLLSR
jgi:Holliday junction DNA helicase RuvA